MKALKTIGLLLAMAISLPVGAVSSTTLDTDAVTAGATDSTRYTSPVV